MFLLNHSIGFTLCKEKISKKAELINAVIAFVLFEAVYLIPGLRIARYPNVLNSYDVLFGTDTRRVIEDFLYTTCVHHRSDVHPHFVLFFNAIGSKLNSLFNSPENIAVILTTIFGAFSVALFFLYMIRLKLNLYESWIFTLLYGFSSSQMIYSAIPETFVFASVSLLVLHLFANRVIDGEEAVHRPKLWMWAAAPLYAIFTFSITVTNYMQAFIVFGFITVFLYRSDSMRDKFNIRYPLVWFSTVIILSLALSIGLSKVQSKVYPTTKFIIASAGSMMEKELSYTNNGAVSNLIKDDKPGNVVNIVKSVIINFTDYALMVPTPEVSGKYLKAPEASFKYYNRLQIIAIILWNIMILTAIYFCIKKRLKIALVILVCLLSNIILHSNYNVDEIFLYTSHTTFLVVILAALGFRELKRYSEKLYIIFTGFLSVILVVEITTSISVMSYILGFLKNLW